MGKFLGGHILLVHSCIKVLCILMILAFEWLHDNIYVICSYKMYTMEVIQRKQRPSEREQTM